jgi:hypothetical protein
MARVYYVDVAIPIDKKKRGKGKTHIVFDGNRVFSVKKLTEPEDASEIYVDAMFSELYDEVLELLRRGTKVYLLKDTTKLKKTDEVDAMLLAQIPREVFKPLTAEELELRVRMEPLIRKYRWIAR